MEVKGKERTDTELTQDQLTQYLLLGDAEEPA